MPLQEPGWWYGEGRHWQTTVLGPIASAYGRIAEIRYRRATPYRSRLPVLCVGNFTAGGTGKTPLALAFAEIVRTFGREPWFLSRGYGGRLDGQEKVNPERHTTTEVGDEPLLLARIAPTVISQNRRLGAEFIERLAPANAVIIMDDGLQNAGLFKDLSIAVVDGARGLGNGLVIPAGPLRAPLDFQAALAGAILVMGPESETTGKQIAGLSPPFAGPVLRARVTHRGADAWYTGKSVVAYAGIANPARFFDMLDRLGARVAERVTFPDHHIFSEADAGRLLAAAAQHKAELVTTEKDFVRLGGLSGTREELRQKSRAIPIALRLDDASREALFDLIDAALGLMR